MAKGFFVINARCYNIQKNEYSMVSSPDEVESRFNSDAFVNWIDVECPTEAEYEFLEKKFNFHHLAVEDCKHFSLFPKMDEYGDYLFVVLHYIKNEVSATNGFEDDDDARYNKILEYYRTDFDKFNIQISEIDFFVTKNSVVTVHKEPMKPVRALSEKISSRNDLLKRGRDFIFHEMLDLLIDHYLEVSYIWDEVVDILEEEVINNSVSGLADKIINLKRNYLLMRRTVAHEKDIIAKLVRGVNFTISKKAIIYLQDVYDHILRLYDNIELNREMLSVIFDAHLSMMSNQMNRVMMKLTIIATVFMPLTFIAGVYGMNFKVFPEIEWSYGYLYVWFLFIVVGTVSYKYFKKNGMFLF